MIFVNHWEIKKLIQDFTTRILQKDTIAIVGPNGSGKSTLLKIFMEKMKIDSGNFKKVILQ